MSQSHKECTKDEIFVGNTDRGAEKIEWFNSKGLTGVRLGEAAYSIDGKPLHGAYRPIIVHRSQADIHNDIMMTECLGPDWRRRI